MNTLSYKTNSVKAEEVEKEWVVVDATDQVLGRLCAKVAKILRGKYKPSYTPHVDCGDNVIIINADKVKMTGKHRLSRWSTLCHSGNSSKEIRAQRFDSGYAPSFLARD